MTNRSKIIIGGLALGAVLLGARRIAQTWGARGAEATVDLIGDDLVKEASVVATRAITIVASPAEIWPWLVQMGWEHGGFYSYEKLENMLGIDTHNAVAVSEAWQDLDVGDEVHVAEKFGLRVVKLVPDQHLVLLGSAKTSDGDPLPFQCSWAFVLKEEPAEAGVARTRLIVRERYHADTPTGRAQVEALQPVSSLMTQRMLRGIRERAEGTYEAA